MKISFITEINEARVEQLIQLYQYAWWAKDRVKEDVEKMLGNIYLSFGMIAEDTDQLIGFARVLSDGIYKAMIYDVVLHADYQGKGFGKLLVTELLKHPKLQHIAHIDLYCLDEMIPFYEQFGFYYDHRMLNLMRLKK